MDTIQSLQWRYATKKFNPEKMLSDKQINVLKEAFNLTATSYGLQPVRLVIISDRELQRKLREYSWDQQQVEDASHLLVFCIENEIDASYISKYFSRVKHIRKTPDEILDPFKTYLLEDFGTKSGDSIRAWAKNQAYLTMGNLLTVCAFEKIDSCPMEGFDPDKYDEILALGEKGLTSVLVMPIGYRADDDIFSGFKKVRKSLNESIIMH